MPKLRGVLGAVGTVIAAAVLLPAMIWGMGHPSLVEWWNGKYLMAGFIALLVAAIVIAIRRKSAGVAKEEEGGGGAASVARGLGVALGALLLLLLLALVIR
jgi:hypothetical protein